MTDREQIIAFESAINGTISRFRSEFNLSLAAAIGTLEICKLRLYREQTDVLDDDEDEDEVTGQ